MRYISFRVFEIKGIFFNQVKNEWNISMTFIAEHLFNQYLHIIGKPRSSYANIMTMAF